MNEILEALQFGFMRHALMAGLLVSIACGVVGAFVVIKRIVFLSGSIAHSAYGGIGLAYYFGGNPILGAILFSLLAATGMGLVQRKTRQRADTLIGVMWAIGMAVGIIFIDLSPGYKADLMSYLFGSILAVPVQDLYLMAVLDGLILLLVALFYKELLSVSFDETFTAIRGVPVDIIYILLMGMIGLTVVMMMRVVGLIMVIALLTIPAAIAGQWVGELRRMMLVASGLGVFFTTTGLWLSYFLNLTSGATIILVAGVGYLISLGLKPLLFRHQEAAGPSGADLRGRSAPSGPGAAA
jgi:zinc transport system permease protein